MHKGKDICESTTLGRRAVEENKLVSVVLYTDRIVSLPVINAFIRIFYTAFIHFYSQINI